MASSPRLQRLLLSRIHRLPASTRFLSTTMTRRASPPSKPPRTSSSSPAIPKTIRVVRPPPRTTPSPSPSPSPPPRQPTHPAQTALRTAEARESALRAARLRRAQQKEDGVVEERKREEAKKEYARRYRTAARKWVSGIIALPIMLVTSWYLFDRLALGNAQKKMPGREEDE